MANGNEKGANTDLYRLGPDPELTSPGQVHYWLEVPTLQYWLNYLPLHLPPF